MNACTDMLISLKKPLGKCPCNSGHWPVYGDRKGWYCRSCRPVGYICSTYERKFAGDA